MASEASACGGTAVSPVSHVLNEKRPIKYPRARRSITGSLKRMIIIVVSYPKARKNATRGPPPNCENSYKLRKMKRQERWIRGVSLHSFIHPVVG